MPDWYPEQVVVSIHMKWSPPLMLSQVEQGSARLGLGVGIQLLGIIIAKSPIFSLSVGSQNLRIRFRISQVLSHHNSLSKSWPRPLKQLQVLQPYCQSPEKQRLQGIFNGVESLFYSIAGVKQENNVIIRFVFITVVLAG